LAIVLALVQALANSDAYHSFEYGNAEELRFEGQPFPERGNEHFGRDITKR